MRRLRVQEMAEQRGYTLTTLHLALNEGRFKDDRVAMGTVRRYWYGTKDGLQGSEPLKHVDLSMLDRIATVLNVDPLELINKNALGEMNAAA